MKVTGRQASELVLNLDKCLTSQNHYRFYKDFGLLQYRSLGIGFYKNKPPWWPLHMHCGIYKICTFNIPNQNPLYIYVFLYSSGSDKFCRLPLGAHYRFVIYILLYFTGQLWLLSEDFFLLRKHYCKLFWTMHLRIVSNLPCPFRT